MKTRRNNTICAAVLALAWGMNQMAFAADKPISIPDELNPPPGNELFVKAEASGTQNYICLQSGSTMAWTFLGPQATLFKPVRWPNQEFQWQIATHFFSPNAAENGTARPTWQSSLDTSAVWGLAIVTVNDPNVVAEGAIPWLLLQAVGTKSGVTGAPGLAQTTYIQRVNTAGGIAPSTGCAAPEDAGHIAYVPYTTDYYFYKAAQGSR